MKVAILSLEGKKTKSIDLPAIFSEEVRPDLIKRAVQAIQSNSRQPYGAKPEAGKRSSAELSRRRRKYRGSYGHGISRVPRKIHTRRGIHFYWVGAFAPGTVGGRRAHPPKSSRILNKKINIKERRKAIRSAIAATAVLDLIKARGHIATSAPLIVDSKIASLSKTKEVKTTLNNLGLSNELKRVAIKKIRAGKGKARGRKYKSKIGPLIVVSENCSLIKAASNIPGVEVCKVNDLNAELLAPGTTLGRLTIYTDKAIQKIATEKLFFTKQKHKKETKERSKKEKKRKTIEKKLVKKVENKGVPKKSANKNLAIKKEVKK